MAPGAAPRGGGLGRGSWGRGCSHERPQLLLLPPGQRFHCGGKKKRRWVWSGGSLISPAGRTGGGLGSPSLHPGRAAPVTPLALLFAPQTGKRGGPVAAGRWQGMLRAGGRAPRGSERRGDAGSPTGLRGNALVGIWLGKRGARTSCDLLTPLLSALPRCRGRRAWSEAELGAALAKGHPSPRSSASLHRSPAPPGCKLPSCFPLPPPQRVFGGQ